MLELKNVVKIYRPKKGVPVKALDEVSVKIPDRGMIFILGKSGSGKSTLLNILGGLDKADSGELIINGKSTNDFTNVDLDSYRNTSVGFVFQEYNVLEEFSIAANIALAMELQGRKASNDELNNILSEVDLEGYGDRKPNELSGGQLQRVAIARALIKNPEIIMADEPTGALDSKTGEQVFETLKKLSKDKAVIVVSHDRDYAELYGDRVIEMADGKIIDDITKTSEKSELSDSGVTVYDDVIKISGGYELTDEDWQMIKSRVAAVNCERYITLSDNLDGVFDKSARNAEITGDAKFKQTDHDNITDTDQTREQKLIKSRMPFRSAFKMGANGLKYKKIRLTVTIITTIISLCLFGVADSMASYDKARAMYESILKNNIEYANFSKQVVGDYAMGTYLDKSDIETLEREGGVEFLPVLNSYSDSFVDFRYKDPKAFGNHQVAGYYNQRVTGNAKIDQSDLDALGFSIKGRLPVEENEIALPHYFFEHYKIAGFEGPAGETPQNITLSADDIGDEDDFLSVLPYIKISKQDYVVTGIIDTHLNSSRYETLKNDVIDITDRMFYEFQTIMRFSAHSIIYFSPTHIEKKVLRKTIMQGFNASVSYNDNIIAYFNSNGAIGNLSAENVQKLGIELFYRNGVNTLADNEAIVPADMLSNLYPGYYDYFKDKYEELTLLYPESDHDRLIKEAEHYARETVLEDIRDIEFDLVYYSSTLEGGLEGRRRFYVAGYYTDSAIEPNNHNAEKCIFMADSAIENIGGKPEPFYLYAIGRMPGGDNLKNLIKIHNQSSLVMENEVAAAADLYNEMLMIVGQILLYCALACILLSVLMLMNFIASSVAQKGKEIGILRAVGARSADVFKIFISESLIISLINFVLGSIAAGIVVFAINMVIRNEIGLVITIMHFGIRQIGIILAATVASAFLGSYLPVYKTAKKKPIDAIRKR